MLVVILPTTEIVNYYNHHEGHTFGFLEGGVREVVSKLVCVSRGWWFNHFTDFQRSEESEQLSNELVSQNDAAWYRRYLHHADTPDFPTNQQVEDTVSHIERDINAMMNAYLCDVPYSVDKVIGWIGHELVVQLSPLRKEYEHPTPSHFHLF